MNACLYIFKQDNIRWNIFHNSDAIAANCSWFFYSCQLQWPRRLFVQGKSFMEIWTAIYTWHDYQSSRVSLQRGQDPPKNSQETPDSSLIKVIYEVPEMLTHCPIHITAFHWCVVCNIMFYWHDDVIKWKNFPRYWPFVWGLHRSPVNSPHKGQWRGALVFS